MSSGYVQRGETIPWTNPSTVVHYGDVVDLDTRIAVAMEQIAASAQGTIAVEGVFDLPAINSVAFTVGMPLYWDGSQLVATGAQNTPAGWCVLAKAQSGTVGRVKLIG